MIFRFALTPVLRLRKNLERREHLALQTLYSQVAEVRSDIKALDQVLSQARSQRSSQLLEGIPAGFLQLELEGEARVANRRQALTVKLGQLQNQVKEQIGKYQQARQRRETMEELQRQQFEEHIRAETTREQRASDELFLLRRIRPR